MDESDKEKRMGWNETVREYLKNRQPQESKPEKKATKSSKSTKSKGEDE